MTQLHRDSTEANKHTPKGFDNGATASIAVKGEQDTSVYDKRNVLTQVINFVDGSLAPPSVVLGDAFVLIDNGGGAIDAGWSGSSYNDWVRSDGGIFWNITPVLGMLCNNQSGDWFKYDGVSWVAFGGGGAADPVLTPNIAHVMPSIGDDATGVVGDISKPFATVDGTTGDLTDGALQACVAGDSIYIYEDITLLTTVSTGIWKSGVNFKGINVPNVTKSTAGDVFKMSGAALPLIWEGKTNFVLDAVAKHLVQCTSVTDISIDINNLSQTIGNTFAFYGGGYKNIFINCLNFNNSGGGAFSTMQNTNLVFKASKVTTAASFFFADGGANNFNNITIANLISTGADAMVENLGSKGLYNISHAQGLTYAYNVSGGGFYSRMVVNGFSNGIRNVNTDLVVNGDVNLFRQESGVSLVNGKVISATILNGDSTLNVSDSLSVSGGFVKAKSITTITYSFGLTMNLTGGVTELSGVSSITQTGSGTRTINGGRLIFKGDFITSKDAIFTLTSGTLELYNCKLNNTDVTQAGTDRGAVVVYQGGDLIVNGATMLKSYTTDPVIFVKGSDRDIIVLSGGLSTNRPENGGILPAKKKYAKFTVETVGATSITINGTVHSSTLLTTKADIAAELLGLVNGGAQSGNVIATQDNAGVDEYFYVEALVAGTDFTIGEANLTIEMLTNNSFALTNVTGGTIIENAQVL